MTPPFHVACHEGDDFMQAVPLPPPGPFSEVTLTYIDMDDSEACAIAGYDALDVTGEVTGSDDAPVLPLHVAGAITATRHPGLFYERRQAVIAWTRAAGDAGTVAVHLTVWSQVGVPGPNAVCAEPPPATPPIIMG
jgi:hypothetical protein